MLDMLVQDQIAYYQARAEEYDQWFLRQGRYDRGPELNQHWFQEVAYVRQAIDRFNPQGHILELACGTGLWTQQLYYYAEHITAVDAAPEVLELNWQRLKSPNITYVQANIFTWRPTELFDVVFFSFWLSHVPSAYFGAFWQMLASAVKPGGRVFLVDSLYDATSTAKDHTLAAAESEIQSRRLNDGREFRVVKIFYKREVLTNQLNQLGWQADIHETPRYFLYGSCRYVGNHHISQAED